MQHIVALYLRLSKEDVDKMSEGDDSASIINQRLLLTEYALEHDYQIYQVYSDDDESGLYDDRPAFEAMIQDAKCGKFDTIVAKSQSRFSRNMEHIEKYLHKEFPLLGVRFIGVVDGVDTCNASNKKTRQINGLVNEWYCEDLSDNIKSTFLSKMKKGEFLGSSAPYGYSKDPDDHHRLIIDEYAAAIVRRIYRLYLSGMGKQKIANMLTANGVFIPTLYKQNVQSSTYKNSNLKLEKPVWSFQTIHQILNNQTYTGDLIQHRVEKASYKSKKKRKIPRSEWIIIENAHAPIISHEIFEKVQKLQLSNTRQVNSKERNIFSGILFCKDCKKAMEGMYERRKGNSDNDRTFVGYICKTYKRSGKDICSNHMIRYEDLLDAVMLSMKEEAKKILHQEDIAELQHYKINREEKAFSFKTKEWFEKELLKLSNYRKTVMEQYADSKITECEFHAFMSDYALSEKKYRLELSKMEEESDLDAAWKEEFEQWKEHFINCVSVSEITKEMVRELIDRIEIDKDGNIDIFYRFSNPYIV